MAKLSKKPKQKPHKLTREELMKRDAMAFAELLLDIYTDKKRKEQSNEVLQDYRKTPKRI